MRVMCEREPCVPARTNGRAPRRRLCSRRLLLTVLLAPIAGGCGDDGSGVGPDLTRDEEWQGDLAFLVDRLEEVHPDMYHTVDPAVFEAARSRLHDEIPLLGDAEVLVEMLRLLTLVAQQRDGHLALGYFEHPAQRIVPLQLYRFRDGVFVVDGHAQYEHLIGKRLVGIGSLSLDAVDRLIDPLIPRDNESSLIGYRNLMYVSAGLLAAAGIVPDAAAPEYRFSGPGGEEVETIPPVDPSAYGLESLFKLPTPAAPPLYLTRRDETFWLEHLAAEGVLYVRLNQVRPTSGSEDLTAFGQRVLDAVDAGGVERVVFDLRQNDGGNNQLIGSILDVLGDARIDQPGRLYVFTDRVTFSAAGNLVAAIADETSATFVGVSPGGSGSQYGDSERFDLPNSGVPAFIPTRHWVFGDPSFQPLLHPMDVTIDPMSADYFEDRDPVLEHVLADPGGAP